MPLSSSRPSWGQFLGVSPSSTAAPPLDLHWSGDRRVLRPSRAVCYLPPRHPRGVPFMDALRGLDWVGMFLFTGGLATMIGKFASLEWRPPMRLTCLSRNCQHDVSACNRCSSSYGGPVCGIWHSNYLRSMGALFSRQVPPLSNPFFYKQSWTDVYCPFYCNDCHFGFIERC